MAKFEITILGCGAPNPTPRHMTTCQVVNYQDKLYMLDCGEAAQWSMQKFDESHADHLAQAKEELDGAILADEGLTIKIS